MTREDVKRYLQFEAPAIGEVLNEPAAVECLNDECEETVQIDPATKVIEGDGVETRSRIARESNRERVEIYCSAECRNDNYGVTE